MNRNLSTLLLTAALASSISFFTPARAADQRVVSNVEQPDNPPPPRDDAGPRRPGGFHLLPPRADEKLKLTPDQQKQLADLDTEVKARLDKILTPEQQQVLEQMRPPRPAAPPGGGPDNNAPDQSQRPAPPRPQENGAAAQPPAPPQDAPKGETRLAVTFTGGYDTDPQDHGRPVVLVAAALNVPSEVFRKAFSNVKPAGPGQEPEPAQVRLNKQTLMRSLSPYGVTDDRLNEVSNYYRYSKSKGEMWRNTPATAYATVRDGVVAGFTVTDPGAGYSSPPRVSVAGMPGVAATASLSFGTDFKTNGSIKEITLAH